MKYRTKRTRLQAKVFRYYLAMAGIILTVFSIFFYNFSSRNLLASQIQAMESINDSFLAQVDDAIGKLDITSININYSNMSKDILDNYFNLTITDATLKNLAQFFIAMSGTELKADQINLYDYSGMELQVGLSTMVKPADDKSMEFVAQTQLSGGSKIITTPYQTTLYAKPAKYNQWFISLYRSFYNQYGRPVGAIETAKQCKSIFKSVITYQKKHKDSAATTLIFDKDKNLIYPYDIDNEKERNLLASYYDTASSEPNVPFESPRGYGKEYATRTTSKYTGFTYLTIVPQNEILMPVHQMLKILAVAVSLIFFLSILISANLSKSIVKPIKHLKHIIQRLELDTLGEEKVMNYPVSVDELEELYQAFELMSEHLKTSMCQLMEAQEQEVKSRSLALQSQMNPHFYYNSLSSIMILAENGENDEVITMCKYLSKIMRYITDSTNQVVTLGDELEYVRKYLYCMKVRYQSSLNYSISVDEKLLSLSVPKLIIQPIVENAIKYGSNCAPPWSIRIESFLTEKDWRITITDSGTGFTEDALNKISSNIQKALENSGLPELKINGLGTLNVFLRWKLFCKEQIIFEYGNTPDGHGFVSIGRIIRNHSL